MVSAIRVVIWSVVSLVRSQVLGASVQWAVLLVRGLVLVATLLDSVWVALQILALVVALWGQSLVAWAVFGASTAWRV